MVENSFREGFFYVYLLKIVFLHINMCIKTK